MKIGEVFLKKSRPTNGVSVCLCVCVISVKGNDTEGESERLQRPHQSPDEAAHGGGDLKARFGGLMKDEGAQTPVESFRGLNSDTWPEDQASLLTFGDDDVADLVRNFKEPLER